MRRGIAANAVTQRQVIGSLQPEHLRVGRVIWFSYDSVLWAWDCPAIIYWVNKAGVKFRVRSLDTVEIHDQTYHIDTRVDTTNSRASMRLPSNSEVYEFLSKQERSFVSKMKLLKEIKVKVAP